MNYNMFNLLNFADGPDLDDFTSLIETFLNSWFTPLVSIAIVLSAIWSIYLGVKFWRASGDEQKNKEAKRAVVAFVLGWILIFLLVVGVPYLVVALIDWKNNNSTVIGLVEFVSRIKWC